jgi:hypothetical protein
MDATLLAHIRSLIDDTDTLKKVSDAEIINLAATRRVDLYFELLTGLVLAVQLRRGHASDRGVRRCHGAHTVRLRPHRGPLGVREC